MIAMRIRPKSNYLHTADWQDLYILTEHWQSDLNFYADELHFLEELISKYFLLMTKKESLSAVQEIVVKINKLTKSNKDLSERIKHHLTNLGLLKEFTFSQNEANFRSGHEVLEDDIVAYIIDFRAVKKEVFTIAKEVLKSEKNKHLLTA